MAKMDLALHGGDWWGREGAAEGFGIKRATAEEEDSQMIVDQKQSAAGFGHMEENDDKGEGREGGRGCDGGRRQISGQSENNGYVM
ncbi:hypothetical protein niasHT_015500 [Heterodera trifolii]|uniref:Uncharacterized protein n=1 Tax=Heterodera trifolii TaxID=157864 RepID=A0ABD2L055_9BILA